MKLKFIHYIKFFIVTVSVSVAYFSLVAEDVPVRAGIQLGELLYDNGIVNAPKSTAIFLRIAAFVSTYLSIGTIIRRKLVNQNHVEVIRELAAQIKYPPMYYPMHRVTSDEWQKMETIAKKTETLMTTVSNEIK